MYILFDIGKTKTRIALAKDLSGFDEPKIFDTPKGYDEMLDLFKRTSEELTGGETVKGVAGGVGAPLDYEVGALYPGPNFPGWEGKRIFDDISNMLAANVYFENDSAVVGLGEAYAGAGKEFEIVAYITVSTGVGGARIVKGKIEKTSRGFEPGWQVLAIDGESKYAEDFLSGRAVEKATGHKPFETTDQNFWDEKARILAHMLNNVAVLWSPDVIVLGGSMMKTIGISVPKTEEHLKNILKIFPNPPILKKAELGDLGGIYGAFELLKQSI